MKLHSLKDTNINLKSVYIAHLYIYLCNYKLYLFYFLL